MEGFEIKLISDQLVKSENLYFTNENGFDIIAIIENDEDLMWAATNSLLGKRTLQKITNIEYSENIITFETKHHKDHTIKITRKININAIKFEKYEKNNIN